MTLETQRTRRRTRSSPEPHPDQILLFPAWCALNGFSDRTGRRIISSGKGPVVTRVSPKIIGITVANNARWQKSRERA
jgi:hypothetical protein